MPADSTLPAAERRNYTGVFNALTRIVNEEGVTSLWRGAVPTMSRAISLNMAMMVSYEEAKERLAASTGRSGNSLYV